MSGSCQVCAYAEAHGHLPGNFTHCGGESGCHRSWRGLAECHCADGCHRHFGGDVAFLAHIAGGVCRDPSKLKTKDGKPRFRPVQRKDGFVWVAYRDVPGDAYGSVAEKTSRHSGPQRQPKRASACTTRNAPLSVRVAS